MLLKNLQGKDVKWTPKGREVLEDIRPRSELHVKARSLLKEVFPTVQLLEEVQIEPMPLKLLYLDFYIPILNMAIEVHGEQHYKFNSFYYKNYYGFLITKRNDKMKKDWCNLNNLTFIELPYNETYEQWKDRICGTVQ